MGGALEFNKICKIYFCSTTGYAKKTADNPTTLNMIACYRQKQTKLFIIEVEVTGLKV